MPRDMTHAEFERAAARHGLEVEAGSGVGWLIDEKSGTWFGCISSRSPGGDLRIKRRMSLAACLDDLKRRRKTGA